MNKVCIFMVDVENIPEHTYYKSWKGNDFFERVETELGGKCY